MHKPGDYMQFYCTNITLMVATPLTMPQVWSLRRQFKTSGPKVKQGKYKWPCIRDFNTIFSRVCQYRSRIIKKQLSDSNFMSPFLKLEWNSKADIQRSNFIFGAVSCKNLVLGKNKVLLGVFSLFVNYTKRLMFYSKLV